MTRAARRQAEKDAGRRGRLRRIAEIVVAILILGGILTVGIVLSTRGSSAGPSHAPARSAAPVPSGARIDDPDLATAFIAAATADVTVVTSYDYRSLDDAITAGLAITTGPYRTSFQQALSGQLAENARRHHVVHAFALLKVGIGVINANGTEAKVLIFGQERVTDDTTHGNVETSLVTLCATMQRTGSQYRISDLTEDTNAGLPPGTADLTSAALAARNEVVDLLSYRRAEFDADLQRALAGAASPLRDQLQRNGAATEAALTKGKYDLSGTVTAVAVELASGDSVTLLVAADVTHLDDSGTPGAPTAVRYEVTVTRAAGSWATSQVSPVSAG
jgi:hypothetical protein